MDAVDKPQSKRAALITFADPKVAVDWISAAAKKDVHLLDSEGIAKMLISEQASINTTLGYFKTGPEIVKAFLQDHSGDLRTKLFAEEGEYDREMAYMGVIIGDPQNIEL